MNRILFAIVAVALILSIFANGCGIRTVIELAPIRDIDIWADNCSLPQYFLYVVSAETDGCQKFESYNVTRIDNTIWVEIFNRKSIGTGCPDVYTESEHTIPLGSNFVLGANYTVEINGVTINLVAGVVMIYPAPILNIEIYAAESLPPQYFVDVLTGEPTSCDYFDSYNMTRASNTTIIVDVFNRRCCTGCPDFDLEYYNRDWHTIPLGSDLVPGGDYTVVVNDVTETFTA